jgi:hypothetical protein
MGEERGIWREMIGVDGGGSEGGKKVELTEKGKE